MRTQDKGDILLLESLQTKINKLKKIKQKSESSVIRLKSIIYNIQFSNKNY